MHCGVPARAGRRARVGRAPRSSVGLLTLALGAAAGCGADKPPAGRADAGRAANLSPAQRRDAEAHAPERRRAQLLWKLAASAQDPERALGLGERLALAAAASRDLDLGLSVRLHVTGPAVLASDPDGARLAYVLQGRVRASVSADPAARPYGLQLGTPCGLVSVPRAAELELVAAGTLCGFELLSGYALLASPALAPSDVGAEERVALAVGKPLACAAGAACREARLDAGASTDLDAPALARYEALVGEQLERVAGQLVALQANERAAVATLRPGPRSDDALALQRKLAMAAADALRLRGRLGTLRATQRATALIGGRDVASDPREKRVRAQLGEAP